jgi:uncharacterized protein
MILRALMRALPRLPFLLLLLMVVPHGAVADQRAMRLPVDPAPLVVTTAAGQASFTIEIADDDEKRAAGLMFREEMADDHGMLFVFDRTRPVSFWMRNTPMALDLVFIDEDGVVRDILPGVPFSEASIGPRDPVRFVLEIRSGIAQKAGIAAGDRVSHPSIEAVADGG